MCVMKKRDADLESKSFRNRHNFFGRTRSEVTGSMVVMHVGAVEGSMKQNNRSKEGEGESNGRCTSGW